MQTLASVTPISALLEALEVGEPLSHGALTVIPLLAPRQAEPDWLTLAEAGAAVTITEVSAGGEVPTLSLLNDAGRPVLLLDGEELIDAKQNRILNATVLVAAHAALRIPVSCVEQGRWSYRGKRFDGSDASLFASARAKKAVRVSTSLRGIRAAAGSPRRSSIKPSSRRRAHAASAAAPAPRDRGACRATAPSRRGWS